jgi:hypothetical protein
MFRKILKNVGIYGYLVFDNNFWVVIGLVLGWTVPMAVLVYMLLRGYESVRYIIVASTIVMLLCNVASGIWSDQWRAWEFTNGPVLGIAAFVITVAAAVWARTAPVPAGIVMILLGSVPVIVEALAMGFIHLGGSTGALSVPGVLAGTLIVLSQLGEKSEIER